MSDERTNPTAVALFSKRAAIVASVTDRVFEQAPELEARYGSAGRRKCAQDAEYHLAYLEQAVALGSAELFADYVAWARTMLASGGLPADDLAGHLRTLTGVIAEHLPPADSRIVAGIVEAALARLPASHASGLAPDSLPGRFLAALRTAGPDAAAALVAEWLDAGLSLRALYLQVLQASQLEIGRLWQVNEISVAEEHYYTAATQLVMARLYARLFAHASHGPTVVIACVSGELHEIGARMVADLLQSEGFTTFFLGANLPVRDLVDFVAARRASVVGLSTTFGPHLSHAAESIRALRSDARTAGVRIVVGGYPYNRVDGLWHRLGADAFAADAEEALRVVRELCGQAP